MNKTLPPLPRPPKVSLATASLNPSSIEQLEQLIIVVPNHCPANVWKQLPGGAMLSAALAKKTADGDIAASHLSSANTGVFLTRIDPSDDTFSLSEQLRGLIARAIDEQPQVLGLSVNGFNDEDSAKLLTLLSEAALIADFKLPTFRLKKSKTRSLKQIKIFTSLKSYPFELVNARSRANNLSRWLGALPPNVLDAKSYRRFAQAMAKNSGWISRFYGESALKKLGAGAFLAVSQGNADRDAGILHLRYKPEKGRPKRRIALVGKGIIFDTGGNNLKPFRSMLDMHLDMQGSAVALASLAALSDQAADIQIDCWLAITENRIGANAYKSQDLIRAMNGKTIQTIHTDAEGRMALADTLSLAARDKPDLIVDFATLTGSCVAAVTSRYSGVFTNRPALHSALVEAGERAGERVWPFPVSAEFTRLLKSDVADLVQCTVDNDGDHILAACFLNEFVPEKIPWIHVDLSAATHKGGLGLVPTEITGFGTRFTLELMQNIESVLELARND